MGRTWGPCYGHVAEVRSGGTTGWGTPEQALTDNGTSASVVSPFAWQSAPLVVKDFRLDLPANFGVAGIVVEIRRDAGWIGTADIRDMTVRLVVDDAVVGENKANTSITWQASTPVIAVYGGPADRWEAEIDTDHLNQPDFGVAFSCRNLVGSKFAANAFVDFIRVTICEGERPLWVANPLGHLVSTSRGPLGV